MCMCACMLVTWKKYVIDLIPSHLVDRINRNKLTKLL